MYLGKIMEIGPAKAVIHQALHPYTRALISAIPRPDPFEKRERIEVKGDLPDQIDLPPGCRFSPRCPQSMEICFKEEPALWSAGPDHDVFCHLINR
jgi:oligopeptide/dipeptide ABC transporter ATP-binding protein